MGILAQFLNNYWGLFFILFVVFCQWRFFLLITWPFETFIFLLLSCWKKIAKGQYIANNFFKNYARITKSSLFLYLENCRFWNILNKEKVSGNAKKMFFVTTFVALLFVFCFTRSFLSRKKWQQYKNLFTFFLLSNPEMWTLIYSQFRERLDVIYIHLFVYASRSSLNIYYLFIALCTSKGGVRAGAIYNFFDYIFAYWNIGRASWASSSYFGCLS